MLRATPRIDGPVAAGDEPAMSASTSATAQQRTTTAASSSACSSPQPLPQVALVLVEAQYLSWGMTMTFVATSPRTAHVYRRSPALSAVRGAVPPFTALYAAGCRRRQRS